jgi:hypothetical protein
MRRLRWPIVFAGILAGTLVALALEQLHENELDRVNGLVRVAEDKLRALGSFRLPVDAYEKDRARVEAQQRFIDEERARQRCPGVVLAALDLERRDAPVEAVVLDGTTLALVGRAESEADVEALATGLRGAAWARTVRAGSARGGGRALRFGLLATVEPPACAEAGSPAPPRVTGR